jgi:hypothetical protein
MRSQSPIALRLVPFHPRRRAHAPRPHTPAGDDLIGVLNTLADTRPIAFRQVTELARRLAGAPDPHTVRGMPESETLTTRLQRVEDRLNLHERRLEALEARVEAGARRFADQDYEIDMLTRVSLRTARRVDRLDDRDPDVKQTTG